jgi:hypothetical protein
MSKKMAGTSAGTLTGQAWGTRTGQAPSLLYHIGLYMLCLKNRSISDGKPTTFADINESVLEIAGLTRM